MITFTLAQIVEASQMTPPQKNVNERPLFIPAGSQDEIALYETSNMIEEKLIKWQNIFLEQGKFL